MRKVFNKNVKHRYMPVAFRWTQLAFGTMTSRDSTYLFIKIDEISRIDAGGKYEEAIKFLAEQHRPAK